MYVLDKQDYKIISKHVNKATGFYVDNNYIKMSCRYDEKNNVCYIEEDNYLAVCNRLNKFGVIRRNLIDLIKMNLDYLHMIPQKIYVIENSVFNKRLNRYSWSKVKLFVDQNSRLYEISTRYVDVHDRYYITYDEYHGRKKIINNLQIAIYKMNGALEVIQEVNSLTSIEETRHQLPSQATVINSSLCQDCNNVIYSRNLFYNKDKEVVKLPLYYCDKCDKYYISMFDFKQNKGLYIMNLKILNLNTINLQEEIERPAIKSHDNKFDENLYLGKYVWNLTYGQGVFFKIQGPTAYVRFNDNLHAYHYPECFKTGILKFVDNEYQKSIMNLINGKIDEYGNTIRTINKNVTIQRTSYTDVRRIPGLVYKIQLIGSSNNHATRIHPVENVVVKLAYRNPKSKMFDIVSIPMHYCSRCDKYFDMKQSFLQTLQKYNLDINYFAASFESETGHPIVFKQMDLREFSKLKLFGYSVGANGLSTGARHELLDFILKNHLMTASEIKSQLQFNIRFIGKKAHMDDAVGDWEKDIDYVNNYISSGKIHWRY